MVYAFDKIKNGIQCDLITRCMVNQKAWNVNFNRFFIDYPCHVLFNLFSKDDYYEWNIFVGRPSLIFGIYPMWDLVTKLTPALSEYSKLV